MQLGQNQTNIKVFLVWVATTLTSLVVLRLVQMHEDLYVVDTTCPKPHLNLFTPRHGEDLIVTPFAQVRPFPVFNQLMQKLADLGEPAQRSQQLHHAHQCATDPQVNPHSNMRIISSSSAPGPDDPPWHRVRHSPTSPDLNPPTRTMSRWPVGVTAVSNQGQRGRI